MKIKLFLLFTLTNTFLISAMDLASDIESQSDTEQISFEQLKNTFKEYKVQTLQPLIEQAAQEESKMFENWLNNKYDYYYIKKIEAKTSDNFSKICIYLTFGVGVPIIGGVIHKLNPASYVAAILLYIVGAGLLGGGAYYIAKYGKQSKKIKFITAIRTLLDKKNKMGLETELEKLENKA